MQVAVEQHENEIAAALQVLKRLDLQGKLAGAMRAPRMPGVTSQRTGMKRRIWFCTLYTDCASAVSDQDLTVLIC